MDQDWPFVDTSSHCRRDEVRESKTSVRSGRLQARFPPTVKHFQLSVLFFILSCSLIDRPEWQQLLERCRQLLASVAQEVPEENVSKLKLTDMALDASIELGHWEEALQYGQQTLPVYRYRECGCVCVSHEWKVHWDMQFF